MKPNIVLNKHDLVITLSSSRRTTRTIEALIVVQVNGAQTLSINNTMASTLIHEADAGVLVHVVCVGWPPPGKHNGDCCAIPVWH